MQVAQFAARRVMGPTAFRRSLLAALVRHPAPTKRQTVCVERLMIIGRFGFQRSQRLARGVYEIAVGP